MAADFVGREAVARGLTQGGPVGKAEQSKSVLPC
jgi:hypothetical protein